MDMIIIDFETRSRCNLLTAGSYNYAQDISTDILCCSFIPADPEDHREFLWYPHEGDLPEEVVKLICESMFVGAHNAGFDRLIWEYIAVADYGFPEVHFDDWYCTQAQMRVNNLPASLEDAARALDSSHQKDHRGKQLIKLLSMPQSDGEFREDPELLKEMGAYCLQDGRTTKSVVLATRIMTTTEHDDWCNNEEINDRGVLIDVELALAAQTYAEAEFEEIATQLEHETEGKVTRHTQSARAVAWASERLHDDAEALLLMTKYVDGEPKLTLDKGARADLLEADELGTVTLPDDVYNVITLLNEGSQSSVSKFKNMALRADTETNKVQGAFVYAGAAQTLRYTSRGLQMHNMPSRDLFKTEEAWAVHQLMILGAQIDKPVMLTLKKMLRHAIMPDIGHLFVVGDWTGIEARVLPWLSDSIGGKEKLDLIATGVDIYMRAAESIGTENRSVGKVMELSLGYEGGVNAFKVFAKSYGVVMLEHDIKNAIKMWRKQNAWVVEFWRQLESAAIRAYKNPRVVQYAGKIRYMFEPTLIEGTLLCILPDDSVLQYTKTRLTHDQFDRPQLTALKASIKMKVGAKEWPRESLYGGRLAGHCAQGTAAALLRDLIGRVDNIRAHVHDELIISIPSHEANDVKLTLMKEMTTTPDWAEGLPLAAKIDIVERYTK